MPGTDKACGWAPEVGDFIKNPMTMVVEVRWFEVKNPDIDFVVVHRCATKCASDLVDHARESQRRCRSSLNPGGKILLEVDRLNFVRF